jgi:hypothetical protein
MKNFDGKMMKHILHSFILIAAILSFPAFAADIDKAMVDKLLAASDQAILKKDFDALGRLMSPDIKITLTANMDGQRDTTTMSKTEYLQAAKEQMRAATDYKYERKSLGVEIVSRGKKGISKDRTTESMRLNGQSFRGVTVTTASIELVNGAPMVTSIVGDSKIEMK